MKPLHPFPARMAPELATHGLKEYREKNAIVLDPMCGSGTVLAEARNAGHIAIGMDLDPLSVLISNCVVDPVPCESMTLGADYVLDRARYLRDMCGPRWPDEATARFASYWFDEEVIVDLAALSSAIKSARITDSLRRYLWCAFSRMIIVKSNGVSRAMDLSHSRPHRTARVKVAQPLERFEQEIRKLIKRTSPLVEACSDSSSPSKGLVLRGDSRSIPLSDSSVDCVVTSPPYLNAIDYLRMSKFTLIWLGHSISELRAIRAETVGHESGRSASLVSGVPWSRFGNLRKLERRHQSMIARYTDDICMVVQEMARVLKVGAAFTVVVGNSAIRGVYVENAEILKWAMSNTRLEIAAEERRAIPDNRRYLPPPRTVQGQPSRMREEVVLTGRKI